MNDINILSDKIHLHFRHPIPSVLFDGGRGILTVGQMINLPDTDLTSIRNFGQTAMSKVNEFRSLRDKANGLLNQI